MKKNSEKLNNKDALQKITSLKEAIFNQKLQKLTSGVERTHEFKKNRREIARLMTQINNN